MNSKFNLTIFFSFFTIYTIFTILVSINLYFFFILKYILNKKYISFNLKVKIFFLEINLLF